MGLFDRFKKKEEPKKVERDITHYSVPVSDGVSEMVVNGLTRIQRFTHRDSSITEVVLGRIERVEENNAFMIDSADYIAFELPIGEKITEESLLAAIQQYCSSKSSMQTLNKSFYVGKIQDGKVVGGSYAVQQYVDQTVSQIEENRAREFNASMEARRREEAAARQKQQIEDEKRRLEYEALRSRERSARKQTPQLKSKGSYQFKGTTFTDYDGVDMTNGDILRLRQVNKVCKDGEGTYLYSAYVNTVEHEYDAEIIGVNNAEPPGDYVCFTLPGRLEDFVRGGNPNQIRTILELLSDERARSGGLSYIGGIDRNGIISRESFPRGPLANRVAQMQQAYLARRQQSNTRNNYSSYDDGR